MPTGTIANAVAVASGSVIGAALSSRLPKRLSQTLPTIFGFAAVTIGISQIIVLENLSAVILALICGSALGELIRIEDRLTDGVKSLESRMPGAMSKEQMEQLMSMVVLFCFSGTGIFGAMVSGVSGDHSVLFAKAIMDFFTAIIFGSTVGYVLSLISIPLFGVQFLLFLAAGVIYPYLTDYMVNDFKACGGIMTFAIGLKIAGIKKTQVLNMVPSLVLCFFFSWMWVQWMK